MNKFTLSFSLMFVLLCTDVSAQGNMPALVEMIEAGNVSSLQQNLAHNNVVNRPLTDGSSLLQMAVYNEQAEVAAMLLEMGADAEYSNQVGMTPLILAASIGNPEITALLLDAGADSNKAMPNGETPLMMAARSGNAEVITQLLDAGADINAIENLRGTTALIWASSYKRVAAMQTLLERGADYAITSGVTSRGRDPYLAPTARERIREFYFGNGLVGSSLEFESPELEQDGSPVMLSREELLKRLPASLVRDFNREVEMGKPESSADQDNRGGLSALHFAVRENNVQGVRLLLEAGADVNQVSEYGWTALLTATQNRYYQLGKLLLEYGADPNIANKGGWNPLYIATDNRNIEGGDYPTRKPDMAHLDFIKLLLANDADPNIRMNSSTETRTIFTHQWLREEGATPLLRAAQSSDIELINLLLEHGADPNINTYTGVTPLMVASGIAWVNGVTYEWSEQANIDTVNLLLELGNDVNAQDTEDGRTALMGAAHKGRNEVVRILVDAGADLDARDIGSRDSTHALAGVTWRAIDYADGLVRVGVQSAEAHPETADLLRAMMLERGLSVPPKGRTMESICIVDICQ